MSTTEQTATALGVSIMSSDAAGAPRLIRAIVPRAAAAPNMAPAVAARAHVEALAPLWIQQQQHATLVDNGTVPLRNGATVVKLSQQIDGAVLDQGELRVLVNPDGSFAAVSGTLLPSTTRPAFTSSASAAAERALDRIFGASRPQMAIAETGETGGWQTLEIASTPDLQVTDARARRELARVGSQLVEAWAVEIMGQVPVDPDDPDAPDFVAHRYLVADVGGRILRDVDLVQNDAFVYRAYAETTGNRRPLDGATQSFAPHPTGVPDGSAPSILPQNLVVMEAFNGPLDPWLATNATTTAGNNAETFSDLDNTLTFTTGDVRPEVKSGRILNYTYDHSVGPLATQDQSKAAAVNSFFVVNWLHDLILAQAGANRGLRNNANMATPADGARPRMRMYLWTQGAATSLVTPSGTPVSRALTTGPRDFEIAGDLVVAADATAPTDDACQVPGNLSGKIALVTFSNACTSAVTVTNIKAGGAIAFVLVDGASNDPGRFGGSAAANLPGMVIGKTAGAALAAAVAAAGGSLGVTLTSAIAGPERDGDLDNTVVTHEWGHYLHHRLTDCGANQCGGMSEGWGDFNALMMMLREGDNRDGVYAIGPYALADGTPNTAYFGIRRFPYSRDRTRNDLSFRHISNGVALPTTTPGFPGNGSNNSEVHNAGEIWATMMWETLNVLADAHGVTVARRRMSDYIVGGMLLAPSDATFTEQRDGILAAASALDTDDMILMAAAFAGRGAGSCAVSPPGDSATNAGLVESGTLAAKLVVGGVTLTDDGISCDHDGYLDPGESGTLHVTVANNGILAAENVTITASTANTGVRIGAPIKFAAVQPFTSSSLSFPVTVLQTAPRNTVVTINVRAAGDSTCDKAGVNLALTIRTGVDDVPGASTIDTAETRISPWTPTGALATSLWGRAVEANGNQSFQGTDAGSITDTQFVSPALQVGTTDNLVLKFKHAYSFEFQGTALFDGGVVEISSDGGTTWSDVTAFGVNPGYTGAVVAGGGNPITGRQAYAAMSPGYPARNQVSLDFGKAFAGKSVQVRFRIGTDVFGGAPGWNIDDVEVSGITNTPFPALVTEPSTCTARRAEAAESAVLSTVSAPARSLRAVDQAVCILNDAP
ncbi:MAG: hypothetical protein E6J91_34560 [Deltaproteobacteria bacterium]|nr:MAG: hypothetical protein E6J91_34560 [Deltaproteobacteria bacterium]